MHLVQVLLPVFDNDGQRFSDNLYAGVHHELTDRFGGVTAYTRAPATGVWKRNERDVELDQMLMVEVMVDSLDRRWWADYRHALERTFRQELIVVRALPTEQL